MFTQGLARGKPKSLTDLEERVVASRVQLAERGKRDAAREHMAALKNVDASTIKRAENKQKKGSKNPRGY